MKRNGKKNVIHLDQILCVKNRELTCEDVAVMASSIGNVGLLQPLVLAAIDQPDGMMKYRVLAGRCRYLALRLLERYELEEKDYRVIDTDEPELISFVENFSRKNLSVSEEISQLAELRTKNSPEELATLLGRSSSYIRLRLQLANLTPYYLQTLDKESFPGWKIGHYMVLSRYPHSIQGMIAKGCWNGWAAPVREFAAKLENSYGYLIGSAPFDTACCMDCENNSAFEPLLFDELRVKKSEQRCLNFACFVEKRDRAVWEVAAGIFESNNEKIRLISLLDAGDRLPPELDKLPHLNLGEFDLIKGAVEQSSANAYCIGGPWVGEYALIAAPDASEVQPLPEAKTLEQRKTELIRRREKRVQLNFAACLEQSRGDRPILPPPGEDAQLLAFVALLGVATVGSWTPDDETFMPKLESLQNAFEYNPESLRRRIWSNLLRDIGARLRRDAQEKKLELFDVGCCRKIMDSLDMDFNKFYVKAEEEIPEPKCLTQTKEK